MTVIETRSGDQETDVLVDQGEIKVGNALIDLLRNQTVPLLSALVSDVFDSAAVNLEEVDPRARLGEVSFPHDELVRAIEKRRAAVEDEFAELVARSFEVVPRPPDGIDFDRLIIQPTDDLEERIAVADMAEHAERSQAAALAELRGLVAHMIRNLGIPIARNALSPEVICNAFRDAVSGFDLPLAGRSLIFRLFKSGSDEGLGDVYSAALQTLDENGIVPIDVDLPDPDESDPEHTHATNLTAPALDVATHRALQRVVDLGGGSGDGDFAEELLQAADSQSQSPEMTAVAQRLSLVGQMCNEILADPNFPESMRLQFEQLRFPLIKIALADPTFFSNRGHPVRRLVSDAAETAASSHIASRAVVRRLEERLGQIAEQTNLSASFVRPELSKLPHLTVAQIAAFLDQQREDSEHRQDSVLTKVRRAIAQEIESHTMARKLPPEAMHFLFYGWGPFLAAQLLRNGMNSTGWKRGIAMLTRVVANLDARRLDQATIRARPQLIDSLRSELAAVGMRQERIADAVNHLEKAFEEVDREHALRPAGDGGLLEDDFELLSPNDALDIMGSGVQAPKSDSNSLQSPDEELERLADSLTRPSSRTRAPAKDDTDEAAAEAFEDDLSFDLNLDQTEKAAPGSIPPIVEDIGSADATPRQAAAKDSSSATDDMPAETVSAREAGATEPDAPAATDSGSSPVGAESADASDAPARRVDVSEFRLAASRDPARAGAPEDLSGATDLDLLGYCLITETWFRVFDARKQLTLWLRVASYYPQHDSVGFSGFDAKQTLSMRASQLVQDLIEGRSDPVNPTPVQARAIAELRSRRKAA